MRPADIWLPFRHEGAGALTHLNLVVQVDGEQHTRYPMYGISVAEQQRKDEQFNQACWERDFRVLRLHHDDKAEWESWLKDCIWTALQSPWMKFMCFTPSYGRQSVFAQVTRLGS